MHKLIEGPTWLQVIGKGGFMIILIQVMNLHTLAIVGNTGGVNTESTTNVMHKFWDFAMDLGPVDDEEDSRSEASMKLPSESGDIVKSFPTSTAQGTNCYAFKIEDKRGRMHRFICDTRSLTDLITCILQRVGDDIDRNHMPQVLYEDEDGDKVVLASDTDLTTAVEHARLAGWKGLRLHLDYSRSRGCRRASGSTTLAYTQNNAWAYAYSAIGAGAVLIASFGMLAYLKRNG